MLSRFTSFLFSLMFIVPAVNAQESAVSISPLPARTAKTDRDALRLMSNEKLDLVLPGALRDNNVDIEYLSYRLKTAGSIKPGRVFSKEAGDTIYEFTGGFPREINILAGQAMLNAYLEDKHAVSPTHVILAKTDYGFEGVHARTPTRTRRSHKSH